MPVDIIVGAFVVIGTIIFLGFFGELVFAKTGIPDVLWLILIGVLLGPSVLAWVHPSNLTQAAPFFTTFALLFLLFNGGLHIRIKDLIKGMLPSTLLTVSTFFLSVLVVTAISWAIGLPIQLGVLLGIILGGTSSAVVIPMVRRLKVSQDARLVLIIESAISDVLVIVVAIAAIKIISSNQFSIPSILNSLFGSFAIAIFIGAIVGIAWLSIEKRFQQIRSFYLVTAAILLLLYGFVEFIQSNGAIAALSFGIVLGNFRRFLPMESEFENQEMTDQTRAAEQFFAQISFFLKTFFFVYIGILMDFTNTALLGIALFTTVVLLLVRPLAVRLTFMDLKRKDRAIMESLIPKGLAAAVLIQLPAQEGIPGTEALATIVYGVIFFSIVLGTVAIFSIKFLGFNGISSMFKRSVDMDELMESPPEKHTT